MTLVHQETKLEPQVESLVVELRDLIDEARSSIASTVNSTLTMLYWHVGTKIHKEILKKERAECGQAILATVSRELTDDYGKGFSEKSLRRMIQFGVLFPAKPIVAALTRQLSWTHFRVLIPIKEPVKRNFYSELCRKERWTVRNKG